MLTSKTTCNIAEDEEYHEDNEDNILLAYTNKFERSAAAIFVYFVTGLSFLLTKFVCFSFTLSDGRDDTKEKSYRIQNAFLCLLWTLELQIDLRVEWRWRWVNSVYSNVWYILNRIFVIFRIRRELISHTVGLV